MATKEQLIKRITELMDEAVEGFNKNLPAHQRRMMEEIELLLKKLDLHGNNIKQTAGNLRTIAAIKSKLDQIISSPEYKQDVSQYLKAFNEVTKLQNEYFGKLSRQFKPTPLLKEIRTQSMDAAYESLMGAGINSRVSEPIMAMMRQNASNGGSYTGLVQQLRDYVTQNETGAGALQRYAKQITTDALNQYSAQYLDAVTNDLGLEWFMYTGALIETSRPFCKALIAKKYVHKSELPAIIKGDFKEFEEEEGVINPKTDLPEGMVPGTNVANFKVYRGGYNCNHQLVPVDEIAVPYNVRISLYRAKGIKFNEKGYKLAA